MLVQTSVYTASAPRTAPITSWVKVSVAPVSSAILRAWAVISGLGKYPLGEATVQCVTQQGSGQHE